MLRNDLVKVDIFDNEIGTIEKMDAHTQPILHRAFSVFLVNSKGEILIQRRALDKYHSAGLWANACCSHPRAGEDVLTSAKERMLDEIGASCDVQELFSFVYNNKFSENLYEYELDHVLLGYYDGDITLNPEEACDYRWLTQQQLAKELLIEPKKFSSWFTICAPRVLKILQQKQNNQQ